VTPWVAYPFIPARMIFWFLRNTHDVSPEGLDTRFATQLGAQTHVAIYSYEASTPFELRLMRALGMHDPPSYPRIAQISKVKHQTRATPIAGAQQAYPAY
jgi:hypothetical protein